MHERINLIVKSSNLTKAKFAEKIGVSAPYVTMLCSGAAKPSDRTISDICRVFNVNRRYLELGEEPMFLPDLDPDTEYINVLLSQLDNPFTDMIRALMKTYMELSPEDQKKAKDFAAGLSRNINDKDRT